MSIASQIKTIESKIKAGKVKNVIAASNKVSNLKSQLAAQNKANIWVEWLAR